MTTSPAFRRRLLCPIGAACTALAPLASGSELPGDSIYRLHAALTDQNGTALELASGRGQPVLVSMFYTSCQMTCPMIIAAIQHTLGSLTPAERDRVRVLMVSFDRRNRPM